MNWWKVLLSLIVPNGLLFVYLYILKNVIHGLGQQEFVINQIVIAFCLVVGSLFLLLPISKKTITTVLIYYVVMYYLTIQYIANIFLAIIYDMNL